MGALKSKFRRSKSASGKGEGGQKNGKKKKKNVNLPESHSARRLVDPRLPFSNYRQIFSIRNAWKAIQRSLDECSTETMIKFLSDHPMYKAKLPIKNEYTDDDDMRKCTDFEEYAMNMYGIFDGVIANLEEVDKALQEIHYSTPTTHFTHKMINDYQASFIYIIRQTLGPDRFVEATENNYKLLYEFIQEEMGKLIEEDDDKDDDENDDVVETYEVTETNDVAETKEVADTEEAENTEEVVDTEIHVDLCTGDAT